MAVLCGRVRDFLSAMEVQTQADAVSKGVFRESDADAGRISVLAIGVQRVHGTPSRGVGDPELLE